MTTPDFPPGPLLAYVTDADEGTHRVRLIDRAAIEDPRERAICRGLLLHALALLDESEPTRAVAGGVLRAEHLR